jgi:dolichyl-diphosphooligosaccharide--protein glycosyltransferase
MEYLIALITYPFHSLSGFPKALEEAVALTPSLIGALTAVITYYFVRCWWGRAAGLGAGLILAFHPKHVEATLLGRFDNEMVEPLFLLVIFWLHIVVSRKSRNVRHWIGLGILSAAFLMVWRGALFPLSLIGLDLILQAVTHRGDGERLRELGKGAGLMYLTAATVMGFTCITNIWGTVAMFSWNIVSWFHVALFSCAAAPFFLLYLYGRRGIPDRRRMVPLALVAVVFLAVVSLFFYSNISEGLKVVGGGNAWIDSISQYQRSGLFLRSLPTFGLLSLLTPLVLILLPLAPFKDLHWKRFLVLWTVVMVAATVSRDRYAEYLALNVAILAGMLVRYCNSMGKGKRASTGSAGAVVILLALQLPTYAFFSDLYRIGGAYNIKGDIEETMLWLRDNTPSPGDPYRPWVKPAYGVMGRWDYGGWIESIALRPSIATNYGTETYGMEEAARFFLASDEEELRKVLERNQVRYVIVDKVLGDLPMYAKLIGYNGRFFEEQWNPRIGKTEYIPSPEVFSLISSRLFFADGSFAEAAGIRFLPVEGLRLVYESASPASVGGFPWEIKRMKVFQVVQGATVKVRGVPGTEVILTQPIETNQGRVFTYNNGKVFDKSGLATFKVLYPRKNGPFSTGATGQPLISSHGQKHIITVRDEDISAGHIIEACSMQ